MVELKKEAVKGVATISYKPGACPSSAASIQTVFSSSALAPTRRLYLHLFIYWF